MKKAKQPINWYVFLPTLLIVGGAALLGLVNNQALTNVAYAIFSWSLTNFAWLYQLIAMVTLIVIVLVFVNKSGRIRFGGPDAKAKFPTILKYLKMRKLDKRHVNTPYSD